MTETTLSITSPAFEHGGTIPWKYTAAGDNVNPPLIFDGVSDDAKSLVLIVDDPDAAIDPKGPGKTYDHWVLFNIAPETHEIAEGSVPVGIIQGKNSAGENKYAGPAPPTGTHRYFFRLYELSDSLLLDENATKAEVQTALESVLLTEAELVGTYQRAVIK